MVLFFCFSRGGNSGITLNFDTRILLPTIDLNIDLNIDRNLLNYTIRDSKYDFLALYKICKDIYNQFIISIQYRTHFIKVSRHNKMTLVIGDNFYECEYNNCIYSYNNEGINDFTSIFEYNRFCVMSKGEFSVHHNRDIVEYSRKRTNIEYSPYIVDINEYIYLIYQKLGILYLGVYLNKNTGYTGLICDISNKTMVDEHLREYFPNDERGIPDRREYVLVAINHIKYILEYYYDRGMYRLY